MRTVLAPNRQVHSKKSPACPDVTLAVVTYCGPEPWYKDRAAIMKMCLDSMLAGAGGYTTELIIWDNGGPPEYKALLKSYHPTVYVESTNIGGYNGRRGMLGLARGKYTCITDDDVLFSSHWLTEQLKIFTAFPGLAGVSGCAKSYQGGFANLVKTPGCRVRTGQIMPEEWLRALSASVGIPFCNIDRGQEAIAELKGVQAWVVKADMQMIGKTETLRELHSPYCEYLGTSGRLCDRMREAGMIQLATLQRTAVHIGNQIDKTVNVAYKQMTGPNPLPILDFKGATWVFRND